MNETRTSEIKTQLRSVVLYKAIAGHWIPSMMNNPHPKLPQTAELESLSNQTHDRMNRIKSSHYQRPFIRLDENKVDFSLVQGAREANAQRRQFVLAGDGPLCSV